LPSELVGSGGGGGGGGAWLDTPRELGCRSRGAVRSIVHRDTVSFCSIVVEAA